MEDCVAGGTQLQSIHITGDGGSERRRSPCHHGVIINDIITASQSNFGELPFGSVVGGIANADGIIAIAHGDVSREPVATQMMKQNLRRATGIAVMKNITARYGQFSLIGDGDVSRATTHINGVTGAVACHINDATVGDGCRPRAGAFDKNPPMPLTAIGIGDGLPIGKTNASVIGNSHRAIVATFTINAHERIVKRTVLMLKLQCSPAGDAHTFFG